MQKEIYDSHKDGCAHCYPRSIATFVPEEWLETVGERADIARDNMPGFPAFLAESMNFPPTHAVQTLEDRSKAVGFIKMIEWTVMKNAPHFSYTPSIYNKVLLDWKDWRGVSFSLGKT